MNDRCLNCRQINLIEQVIAVKSKYCSLYFKMRIRNIFPPEIEALRIICEFDRKPLSYGYVICFDYTHPT
jgi:hypothetical protein